MVRGAFDVYASTLFEAEIPDVTNPVGRRRPPPNVPLKRQVRDAIEDALEKFGVEGLSWAWSTTEVIGIGGRAVIVLSDCRDGGDSTVGIVLNDDAERDVRNLRHHLLRIRSEKPMVTRRLRQASAAAA